MPQIRVSPERLRSAAATLESNKAQADEALSTMIRTVNGLSDEWSGMAQVNYANLFAESVPHMQAQMNEILDNLARGLRQVAQTFEEVDQRVIGS